MLFNSYSFLLFFPLVLIVVGLVPARWKNPALLLASYYFYSCFSKRYCLLLLGCTLVVYFAARLLRNRKWAFWCGLTILLGVLALFKYTDFALYTLEKLLGKLGTDRSLPRLNLILPMGISFFTFQAAGYLMDVYKGKYPPEENFVRFALFVSFFPQLVSGPIGRGDQLLPQYAAPEKPRFQDLRAGLLTLTWGYFLKLVIADRAAILVDTVYGNIQDFPGICLVFATMLYALQILCDFSGCSSMAIGAARMLGIRLPENFNAPYFAQSIQEFWRRWHISLSTWFRDYVYFPLGGSRCGRWKTYRNILIVFLLSGLWHGANWSFVVWGLLHGLYQIIGRATRPCREKALDALGVNRDTDCFRALRMAVTFLLVDFAWIFFRAENLSAAVAVIGRILADPGLFPLMDALRNHTMGLDGPEMRVLVLAVLSLLGADILHNRGVDLQAWFAEQNWLFRELLLITFMLIVFIFGIWGNGFNASSFIYFQF